jgi:hypothetical protein
VDGWLGFMVGTELWYPLWEISQVGSTADALSNLIGENAKLSTNQTICEATMMPGPANSVTVPSSASNTTVPTAFVSPTTSLSESDAVTVFKLLADNKNLKYPVIVKEHLKDIGVTCALDLTILSFHDSLFLMLLLKPIPQRGYISAMHLEKTKAMIADVNWEERYLRLEVDPSLTWGYLSPDDQDSSGEAPLRRFGDFTQQLIEEFGLSEASDLRGLAFDHLLLLTYSMRVVIRERIWKSLQLYTLVSP